MVKTNAESGIPAEKVESFVVNNQNVPALPEQEAVWSFSSSFVADQCDDSKPVESSSACDFKTPACDFNTPRHQRSDGTVSSWPPNNWRTAPDFKTSHRSQHRPLQETKANDAECVNTKDDWFPVNLEEDWVIKEDIRVESTEYTESTVSMLGEPPMVMSIDSDSAPAYLDLGISSPSEIVDTEVTDFNERMSNASEGRDRLRTGAPDSDKLLRTGRIGEGAVYKHFLDKLGYDNVKWMNKETESGKPYDLVINRGNNLIEYVEVKATTSSNKDWFYITTSEWQFALEKGDQFTIARIVLSGDNTASIELFTNPHMLCQKKKLHLALLTGR